VILEQSRIFLKWGDADHIDLTRDMIRTPLRLGNAGKEKAGDEVAYDQGPKAPGGFPCSAHEKERFMCHTKIEFLFDDVVNGRKWAGDWGVVQFFDRTRVTRA